MGEVIRFVSKTDRERVRMIRQARAIYDSVFPPPDRVSDPHEQPLASSCIDGWDAPRGNEVQS